MQDLAERIKRLEHENELLKVKVDKNTGDCEQLWMVVGMFYRPNGKPSLNKIRLDKKSFATVIVSLLLGASSFTFRFLQLFGLV